MIGRNISQLVRAPRSAAHLLTDRVLVRVWLRAIGVAYGSGCRFDGFPVIRLARKSELLIGNRVLINNRVYGNAATMTHRTSLTTLREHASIRIHDDVGLSGNSIAACESIEIGARTMIGSGSVLWDTDFHPLDPEMRRQHPTHGARSRAIRIEEDVFVGARSMILKGVTIGQGSIVGAGSVVTSSIPAGVIAAGNPAKVIRQNGSSKSPA